MKPAELVIAAIVFVLNAPALAQEQEQSRSNAGAVLGGIAGAVIGHQIGGGSGRVAATAILGVAGAIAGDRIDNDKTPPALRQERSYRRNPDSYSNHNGPARGNGGAILGGLTGAIVGSQIGQGNGRTAAIAALAITGAIAGDRLENDNDQQAPQPPRKRRAAQERPYYDWDPGADRAGYVDFSQYATDPRVSVR